MIELLSSLNYREPLWLLIAIQPGLIYFITYLSRKLRKDNFIEPHLIKWMILDNKHNNSTKQQVKYIFLIVAWICFAIAMAGPRIAEKYYKADNNEQTNIIVLFDVSRSMSARDIHPSRLERAKLELYDFIERVSFSRISLVVYASNPHLLSPLTDDKNILRHYTATISTPLLPTRGSDLKSALQFASTLVDTKTTSSNAILLISDGENNDQTITPLIDTLTSLKNRNIPVYSLLSGTTTGTPLIDNESGWLKYNNQDIVTRAQPDLLQEISLFTNGSYSEITEDDNDWHQLYDKGIATLARSSLSTENNKLIVWKELNTYPTITALAFFILAFATYKPGSSTNTSSVVILCIFSFYLLPGESHAESSYQDAYKAYQQQDYQMAGNIFAKLTGYEARIGEANAAYMSMNYKKSIAVYIQATLEAKTDQQRSNALFNLANSYYQLMHYDQAANIYRDVLIYNPGMKQAEVNLAYAMELNKKQLSDTIPTTSRGGKGPRIAKITPGADITKGNLTLSGDSNDDTESVTHLENNIQQDKTFKQLLSAESVTDDIQLTNDSQWTYEINSPNDIAPLLNQVTLNEPVFWKRLFEWEEGYPAPLSEPQNTQGKLPW